MKNHSRNLHAPLCGIFCPNSVAVARYGALIRTKSPTNCDAHLAESLFQTRSNARNAAARGLYKKLGIRYVSITSGKNKDSSKFTDEQIAIYQDQINEAYEKFVNIVADGRDMSVEDVKKLADGRTYTAKQAKNNGLIDEISLYPDMKDAMSKKLGTSTFYEMESDEGLLQSLFQSRIISSEVRSAGSDGNRQKCRKRGADVLCRTVTIIRRS
mgnify:CR=1 FL=1